MLEHILRFLYYKMSSKVINTFLISEMLKYVLYDYLITFFIPFMLNHGLQIHNIVSERNLPFFFWRISILGHFDQFFIYTNKRKMVMILRLSSSDVYLINTLNENL